MSLTALGFKSTCTEYFSLFQSKGKKIVFLLASLDKKTIEELFFVLLCLLFQKGRGRKEQNWFPNTQSEVLYLFL